MAFNLFKWLFRKTEDEETGGTRVQVADFLDKEEQEIMGGLEVYLSEMAFWTIIRKIGSAVAAVEWVTFRQGKSVKAKEYWAWNHSPNPNQSKEQFFQKLVSQLFKTQEVLIIEVRNGYRYVADSFTVTEKLTGNIYRDIVVNNESVPGTFMAKDVIHLAINGSRVKAILSAIASTEGKLLKSSTANYIRGQGMRGVLEIDDLAEASPDFEETYNDLVNDKFKKFYNAENAVLPLFKGYKYTENGYEASGSASTSGTRDIRNMIDDIVELTAQTMGVPASIATGKNVTDADFKSFMTSTVCPIVNMIVEEINRKIYNMNLVYAGTYVVANYGNVRYTDLFDVANPIDKLIGSGAFCINDIRKKLGLDVIEEPWAWQHWMTKNYSSVEDLLEGIDGNPGQDPEETGTSGEEETE